MSYIRTPEIRAKISLALREAHKKHPGDWRGPYSHSESTRKRLSEVHKGRKLTPEWIENRTKAQRGLKRSAETRKKLSEAKKGAKCPFWKGGISEANRTERQKLTQTIEYILWRESVFRRDDFTCQICLVRGGTLQADHIKPWALFPDLRLAIDNGRTLCVLCHRKTDTYGSRSKRK